MIQVHTWCLYFLLPDSWAYNNNTLLSFQFPIEIHNMAWMQLWHPVFFLILNFLFHCSKMIIWYFMLLNWPSLYVYIVVFHFHAGRIQGCVKHEIDVTVWCTNYPKWGVLVGMNMLKWDMLGLKIIAAVLGMIWLLLLRTWWTTPWHLFFILYKTYLYGNFLSPVNTIRIF